MNDNVRGKLIKILKNELRGRKDPSHDIGHSLRVLNLSEHIGKKENADLEIVVPSAIFHDVISYPKNHHKRLDSAKESAKYAKKVLENIEEYPKKKINKVYDSIHLCSFTKGVKPDLLEAMILQDADSLESMGAISIMRTFASSGVMNISFYDYFDPFCKERSPNDKKYALDLFYTRLLIVKDRLHTKSAKMMAERRHEFLNKFILELRNEIK